LNAGSSSLGRADGFDVVHLLERVVLIDMPKGADGKTSLLQHIRDKEISSSQREAFGELERVLQGWKIPVGKEDETDPTDLDELQKDSGAIWEQLSRLENDLHSAILRHVGMLAAGPRPERSARAEQSRRQHLERQLELLRGYDTDVKRAHRVRIEKVDAALGEMRESMPALQHYLLQAPTPKKRFSAARILGVMAQLSQKLAPQRETSQARGVGRRGKSAAPPVARAASRQAAPRRSASMDSVRPPATARAASREPAGPRASKPVAPLAPFLVRRS